MKLSLGRWLALMAALFTLSYTVGSVLRRTSESRRNGGETPALAATQPIEDEAAEKEAVFAKTADRITMGSGFHPEPAVATHAALDEMLRGLETLPDGEEKTRLAHEIGTMRDPAAAPVLLDWAVSTTDRAVLRSALEALTPVADAALLVDIRRRYGAAVRSDDRYRLAKVVRNFTNAEVVPALVELAEDEAAPEPLVIAATEALATLATPPAVSLLLNRIGASEPDDVTRLLTAISRIDRVEALPSLQYAAQGNKDAPSELARVAAIHALANFRDDQTRELLHHLTTDPADAVRDAAREILARAR